MEVKDYIEIGIGAYLLGEAFKGCLGPTKKQIEEAKAKAIEKRKKATRVYWQAGKLWAEYYDPKCNVSWREEIKEDPFHLY